MGARESAPDFGGSSMIALYPPAEVAAALAVAGGLPPSDMHVTMAYTGPAADVDVDVLASAARQVAARPPIEATISGHARFTGDDDGDVIVALVDSPAIERLRRDLVDALTERGITLPGGHGFTAHQTITYLDPGRPSPVERIDPIPVVYDTISVAAGGQRIDVPFAATLPQQARAAYAEGWARSGGPMTDRVRAGCLAAVEHARENATDPGILELTLHLGHLEGVWATVYDRRFAQIRTYTDRATQAWKQLLTRDEFAHPVGAFARAIGVAEADAGGRDEAIKAAAASAAGMLTGQLADRAGWASLRQSMRDALAAGRAEGAIDAVAIAADRLEHLGINWDIAFNDAYKALDDLDQLWADADGWLAQMLQRAAADLGRALAAAARAGDTYPQMLAAAMQVLDSDDVDAVAFITDWAMTTAQGAGALALYASEGVEQIDWMTAGDDRVCVNCEANEDNGPYTPATCPFLPEHPLCRCCLAASFSLTNYQSWLAAT